MLQIASLTSIAWVAVVGFLSWLLPWRLPRLGLLVGLVAWLYYRSYGLGFPSGGPGTAILFCREPFLYFFVAVFSLYWTLPWHRARVWLLLGASYYFYASWSPALAFIVFASALMDYCLARGMEKVESRRGRRLLLGVSLVVNLGILGYFKYANFFLHSLEASLQAAGLQAAFRPLQVVLPVGISFYTFEAINYTVDVYRRRIPAERNLAHFLLFILFFPHLVAGPIVRARGFLPQVARPKRWDWLRFQLGVQLFLLGLFKKLVLADRMSLYADPVFADPGLYGTFASWVGTLAYAVQIYCDFSGYTDMALGAAHMLGYKLAQNFNMPYLSANVSEFWRRWHISLSSWLRDYLYIPLGGSRGGRALVYRNLLLTMTLGGLWHGASWTFVAWGLAHGLLLIGHRLVQGFAGAWPRLAGLLETAPGTAVRRAVTLLCVVLAWVPFRATTFGSAAVLLGNLVRPHAGLGCAWPYAGFYFPLALVVLGHLIGHFDLGRRLMKGLPGPALGLGYAAALSLVLLLNLNVDHAFIYFQF
jgi:alginate O-acetyltransferase complex protein AlgI